ncbi:MULTISPECIES: SIMPL domain-containing protein [unclassified Acinetobacter]|uniref:SIMPL domain-containing protein n=1 Tax=unclassified Acinetobacter TaxID=196816 RepID=UPI0029351D68|nr:MULTISPECIES: SIMPL domain-containing protein [unclassified Acinetobacter]WOE32669.1 SIMPL domain-containing protein [Acinetobacter sp. SAAs470]WOE38145.1 SIMPL domain-containing protein [Acinetobacter sp. SAAs474]
MRYLLTTSLLFMAGISSTLYAQDNTSLNYNIANIQAEASRDVANDEMHAVLYIEKSNKQPTLLSSQINQAMNQAIAIAKKYPSVKLSTGAQSSYPVYNNDNRKLQEWRGRAEIRLESTDFKATSELINALHQNFQTQSVSFTVSEAQRSKVENELIVEASKNLQQRAQLLTQTWSKSGYNLVNLQINTQNYYSRPVFAEMAMAKLSSSADAPPQEMAGGESKVSVSASGTIQFK